MLGCFLNVGPYSFNSKFLFSDARQEPIFMTMTSVVIQRDKCVYTKCYCEENVWQLCKLIQKSNSEVTLSNSYAIFISNPNKTVPIWQQKSSERKDTMVVWDYHVVLYVQNGKMIYDLDTLLSFPASAEKYMLEALRCDLQMKPKYQQFLRVVPCMQFLKNFASDRSHMLKGDGTWLSPPPDYPSIRTSECTNSLSKFLDMTENLDSLQYGKVFTVDEFMNNF